MKEKRINYCLAAVTLLTAFVLAGFAVTPFTADLKVFLASAHQATYIDSNLIVGGYKVWELKGPFSRVFIYGIYKIAVLFADYGGYSFEVCCKLLYAAFIFAVSFCTVNLLSEQDKKVRFIYIMLIAQGCMAVHTMCIMQAEMTVSLLLMLSFALYANAVKTNKNAVIKLFAAGILIGSAFFFKSVLILMSVSVVAAIIIYNVQNGYKLSFKRMMIVVAGSVFIIAVNCGVIMAINPQEFRDMLDASHFQNTLLTKGLSVDTLTYAVSKFISKIPEKIYLLPIVMAGAAAFICNLLKNLFKGRWLLIFGHMVLWVMPTVFIMLSNKYFAYHLMVYLCPAMMEIYYAVKEKGLLGKIVVYAAITVSVGLYVGYMSVASHNVKEYIRADQDSFRIRDEMLVKTEFEKDAEMMYLDDGLGAYYLPNESYLRYYFPLPLQRLADSDLECYVQTKREALEYEGKYISVYESWFFRESNNDIKEKVEKEYEYIASYARYSPSQNIFDDDFEAKEFMLYQRKE